MSDIESLRAFVALEPELKREFAAKDYKAEFLAQHRLQVILSAIASVKAMLEASPPAPTAAVESVVEGKPTPEIIEWADKEHRKYHQELVERVARAICEAEGYEDDWENPTMFMTEAKDTAESCREIYRDMARAALSAISPTTAEEPKP